jgi:DNA-binding transcriptional LysR family regulator
MDLTQLRYFQAVARTGNVSRAADELFVTQPNLSKSIARLEEELGVPLFDHRKGKIVINEYGRVFLSSVENSFAELDSGAKAIQRMYESGQGVLSLACSIDEFLPDLLSSFSLLHPEIRLRQFGYDIKTIVDRLLDRSLDLAISSHSINEEKIIFKLLGEKEYVILTHRDHTLAGREEVAVRDLAKEKFICDSSRLNLKKLRQICGQQGFEPAVGFEVQSSELIYQLLEGNAGIAFMTIAQFAKIKTMHPGSDIRLVRIKDAIPPAIIGIAYHRGYVFSKSAELFVEFMKEWLAKEERVIHELGY